MCHLLAGFRVAAALPGVQDDRPVVCVVFISPREHDRLRSLRLRPCDPRLQRPVHPRLMERPTRRKQTSWGIARYVSEDAITHQGPGLEGEAQRVPGAGVALDLLCQYCLPKTLHILRD